MALKIIKASANEAADIAEAGRLSFYDVFHSIFIRKDELAGERTYTAGIIKFKMRCCLFLVNKKRGPFLRALLLLFYNRLQIIHLLINFLIITLG